MTKIDATNYSISVRHGDFGGELCFEARVKELPDLAEYADSWQQAYELALDAIETTATVLAEQGRAMPQPGSGVDDYSGRVTLRVPRTLHRSLALMAEDEGVSLNQLMVSALADFRGFCSGAEAEWRGAGSSRKSSATPLIVESHEKVGRQARKPLVSLR